jgi:hypothetical protein
VWLFGGACFLLAVPCALSGKFMGILILIFFKYALLVGGFFICLFVGWGWGTRAAISEMTAAGRRFPLLPLWAVLIRFVCPVVIAIIVGNQLWTALKPASPEAEPPPAGQSRTLDDPQAGMEIGARLERDAPFGCGAPPFTQPA